MINHMIIAHTNSNCFTETMSRNKQLLLQCIGLTFLWGLIAHGFMFANNNLSWDSLVHIKESFYPYSWKASLGRIFVPIYEASIRGRVTIPWLIGILSLLYISIALLFISKIFNIQSAFSLFIIAGILTVNPTITSITATYISDLDADMLAMLLSVIAVYCWQKLRKGYLYGAIPLMLSLGLYQSYISTTIVLIIFVCVLNLLRGGEKPVKNILYKGLSAICMMLIAGGLYFCALKLTCAIFDQQLASGEYNSLDTALSMSPSQIIHATWGAFWNSIVGILCVPSICSHRIIRIITSILLLFPFCIVMKQICSKNTNIEQKILIVLLLAITPLCMNICQVLTNNMSHNLMHYAFWLTYLFVLLIFRLNEEEQIITRLNFLKWSKIISVAALFILLIWQVRLANLAYFAKDIENKAIRALYTRVINDIEEQQGYLFGETRIALIGNPTHLIKDYDEKYHRTRQLTGMAKRLTTEHSNLYITQYLMYPASIIGIEETNTLAQTEIVASMPIYPSKGSIQMIDNICVVKLGEIHEY